jgi:hypothetical protein
MKHKLPIPEEDAQTKILFKLSKTSIHKSISEDGLTSALTFIYLLHALLVIMEINPMEIFRSITEHGSGFTGLTIHPSVGLPHAPRKTAENAGLT